MTKQTDVLTCATCGKQWERARTRGPLPLYCSRYCRHRGTYVAAADRPERPRPVHYLTCRGCGTGFQSSRRRAYCSARCRGDYEHTCNGCGSRFKSDKKTRMFCSNECYRSTVGKNWRRRSLRISSAVRRKRIKQGGYERFDPMEVLNRDNWRCQLCGIDTPRKLRGTYDDRAPELDHIVPLSKGGAHTRENTQCLCRSCNLNKGARTTGQPPLAPAHCGGEGGVDL